MEGKTIIKDKEIRVDERFNNELEEIKGERLKKLIDTKKTSNRKITSMIPKHDLWIRIKRDIINHIFDKDDKEE
ncbi:hypothetical protein LCGC14_2845390 [marine sediment metagenome]|uniref:Uncharacterized protein n=1 Tax=marine sediment metagenome TaxID=412755 RepID=A0A0F9AIB5_9ZZZZ